MQQFQGVYNYHRRFICQYAAISAPLTDSLQQKETFNFGVEQKKAFQELKNAVTQAPILTIFDLVQPKRVLADTSGFASGAILEQLVNGNWHPAEYFSKCLSEVESRPKTEREMLGCILALERWQPYLVDQPFDIINDHTLLQFYKSYLKLSKEQIRWLESLADFQPTFVFKHGKLRAVPDALSRLPVYNYNSIISVYQALHEALLQAQKNSIDQEFLTFKWLATQANSRFTLLNELMVKMVGTSQCIVLPEDEN